MQGLRALFLGLLGLLVPLQALAQDERPDATMLDPADPPAVVRTASDRDNRVTIPIHIEGKGPYAFVVDTGSQRTVVSRELADRLALAANAPVNVVSMTGLTRVDTVTLPHVSFGATSVREIRAPVFLGAHLGAEGLLGLDGLESRRLILDFRSGRMEIGPTRRRRSPENADAIVVTARSKLGQLILLNSDAEGHKVNVILDTGSEYSIGNIALLKRLAHRKKGRFSGMGMMMGVTGETMEGQWGTVRELRMGSLRMIDLPVMFADAAPFAELGLSNKPALLLGISALRGFQRVAIDFGAKRVDFLLPDQGALSGRQLAALDP
ncbi:MAG: aspartyl protease family protein [Sphingobium sp.]|uniref:aspartyl protease family protein n=1 Tax=Sphingobium sp. TaxID=1912891 RepID=UPI0029B3370D|nr:aspartyl protease family protein [Sphingobium sp.]MDX3908378.1 aspartyl protease family protein [Sphingobium sp.]